jgi:hypothetical protein
LLGLVNLSLVDILHSILVNPVLIFVYNRDFSSKSVFEPYRCPTIGVNSRLLSKQQSWVIDVNRIDLLLLGDEDRLVYGFLVPINDELGTIHLWVFLGFYSKNVLVIEFVDEIHSILVNELKLILVVFH